MGSIIKILVHCCLQERTYNRFYFYVISRLAHLKKSHRTTLRFIVLNHLQKIAENIKINPGAIRTITNLARFVAALFISGSISISILKKIEFSEISNNFEISYWRICLTRLFEGCKDTSDILKLFGYLSAPSKSKEYSRLRVGLKIFISSQLVPWLANKYEEAHKINCLEYLQRWNS